MLPAQLLRKLGGPAWVTGYQEVRHAVHSGPHSSWRPGQPRQPWSDRDGESMERSVRLSHPVHLCEGLNDKTSRQGSLLPKVHKDSNILGPAAQSPWPLSGTQEGEGLSGMCEVLRHTRWGGAPGQLAASTGNRFKALVYRGTVYIKAKSGVGQASSHSLPRCMDAREEA